MSKNLTAFLAQNAKKIDNVTFTASERFTDPETGGPMPGRKGQFTQDFDVNAYLAKVSARCTVFPNLNDAGLQQSYGVMGAEQLITTMLTPAEFEDYSTKVLNVNGFQSGEEMVDEAKN